MVPMVRHLDVSYTPLTTTASGRGALYTMAEQRLRTGKPFIVIHVPVVLVVLLPVPTIKIQERVLQIVQVILLSYFMFGEHSWTQQH